jgi:transposase
MTLNKGEQVEVVTSVQRRRRWAAAEKRAIVQESYQPGMSVSAVARTHGIAPNQLFDWRRRMEAGALTAMAAADNVVPERQLRELEAKVHKLERVLGQKTVENEILKEAVRIGREKNSSRDSRCAEWMVSSESGSPESRGGPVERVQTSHGGGLDLVAPSARAQSG